MAVNSIKTQRSVPLKIKYGELRIDTLQKNCFHSSFYAESDSVDNKSYEWKSPLNL